jgi:hypothetical protein
VNQVRAALEQAAPGTRVPARRGVGNRVSAELFQAA